MEIHHIDKRIIVFGGHPKWIKQIKGSINIKFVQGDNPTDYKQIKHYEELWLYTQAIRHSTVRNCIRIAKANNVVIKTFKHTSAVNCISEIVNE